MQTNHVVCDHIQHGVPEVEVSGPVVIRGRASVAQTEAIGTHEKTMLLR